MLKPELLIAPLERYRAPESVDGRNGRRRSRAVKALLAVDTDADAVKVWLKRYKVGSATFAAYRKEVERLLLWANLRHGMALSDLDVEDIQAFIRFLGDPQPAAVWLTGGASADCKPKCALMVARTSPMWRPFAKPLGPSSQNYALQVLGMLFNWLYSIGYLSANPMKLLPRIPKQPKTAADRCLLPAQWEVVLRAIDRMQSGTAAEKVAVARARWCCSLLYHCGLRISELAAASMSSITRKLGADGKTRWCLKVVAAGASHREIPFSEEMLRELARYRRALSLSPLPLPTDSSPLVRPLRGTLRHLTSHTLGGLLKETFSGVAKYVRQQGPEFEDTARRFEAVSAGWLRHSAGTIWETEMGLEMALLNLGHSMPSTTSLYLNELKNDFAKRYDRMEEMRKG